MEQIPSVVGLPVHATFENGYDDVQKAIITGGKLPTDRPLGHQVANLAGSLARDGMSVSAPKKHRFLEVFALAR